MLVMEEVLGLEVVVFLVCSVILLVGEDEVVVWVVWMWVDEYGVNVNELFGLCGVEVGLVCCVVKEWLL